MLEAILFYGISFGMILAALGVITSRSAIYSVLCLVIAMGMMAALFVLLKAYLVATILILVYAGAILVLFLFVVMLVDFKSVSFDWGGLRAGPVLAMIAGGLFLFAALRVVRSLPPSAALPVDGTARTLGRELFQIYVLPFELTGFLILAAVVSVVVLAKKEPRR